jgi:hypothetical protein
MTNREAAKYDQEFRAACERAGVFPSRNQFRKWKFGRGIAYLTANHTTREQQRAKRTDLDKNQPEHINVAAK